LLRNLIGSVMMGLLFSILSCVIFYDCTVPSCVSQFQCCIYFGARGKPLIVPVVINLFVRSQSLKYRPLISRIKIILYFCIPITS
jgi:hypothetical protein